MKRENFDMEEATPWPVRIEEQLRQAFMRIARLEADLEDVKPRRKVRKAARS